MHKMTSPEIEHEVLDPIEFYTNIRAFPDMRGEEYCLVVIAEPISLPVIDGVIKKESGSNA